MSEALGQIKPRFSQISNLTLPLCLQYKSTHLTVWQTFFLKPCYFGLNKFQNFQPFLWTGHFPPRHGITHYPSNINLFVLNPILLLLKCIASF